MRPLSPQLQTSSASSTRRPLRGRCNLAFRPDLVQEASQVGLPNEQTSEPESIDESINVPEHSSLLTHHSCEIDEEQGCQSPTASEPPSEIVDGLSDLQTIIPGLSVALTHDTANMLGYNSVYSEHGFTHVLNVLPNIFQPSGDLSTVCVCPSIGDNGLHRLRLGVLQRNTCYSQDQIRLTKPQLAIARDFLSLALPYSRFRDRPPGPCGTEPHVLVTSSFDCPADAMAIVACYLDFISAHSAATVWSYFVEQEYVLDIWKDALTQEWELDLIEDAAELEL